MIKHKWEHIEEQNAFLGDLKDFYGRRILLIVTNGIAVFAKCDIEDYLIMKDDFLSWMNDFHFELGAKIENGIPHFEKEMDELFDTDTQEEIMNQLIKSLK